MMEFKILLYFFFLTSKGNWLDWIRPNHFQKEAISQQGANVECNCWIRIYFGSNILYVHVLPGYVCDRATWQVGMNFSWLINLFTLSGFSELIATLHTIEPTVQWLEFMYNWLKQKWGSSKTSSVFGGVAQQKFLSKSKYLFARFTSKLKNSRKNKICRQCSTSPISGRVWRLTNSIYEHTHNEYKIFKYSLTST